MAKEEKLGLNIINMSFSKCMVLVISTVSAMLLSRFRTLEEYGTYSQLLTVVSLFSSIFMLGLPNCINYFLARAETEEEKKKFLNVYYTLSTILSFFVGLVLVSILPLIVRYFDNKALQGFIYFLILYPWTKIVIGSISNVLIVYNKTRLVVLYSLLNSAALLLSILIIQWCHLGFQAYMICFITVEVLFSLLVYLIVRLLAKELKPSLDKKVLKSILKFSIPLGIASMVGTISIELDKLVIGAFFDTETYAIYANASKELPFTIFASAITAVVMPKLVICLKKEQNEQAAKLWGDTALLSLMIMALFVGGLVVFAPQIMTILYSEKYLDGVNVFRIYSLVLLLRITYFGMILNSKGKTKFILYSSIASLVLNLGLNILFVMWLGLIGPAIATAISIFIVQVLQLIISSKEMKVRFNKIFGWFRMLIVLLVNFAFASVFLLIKWKMDLTTSRKDILISIGLGAVWSVIYFVIMIKPFKKVWYEINNYEQVDKVKE